MHWHLPLAVAAVAAAPDAAQFVLALRGSAEVEAQAEGGLVSGDIDAAALPQLLLFSPTSPVPLLRYRDAALAGCTAVAILPSGHAVGTDAPAVDWLVRVGGVQTRLLRLRSSTGGALGARSVAAVDEQVRPLACVQSPPPSRAPRTRAHKPRLCHLQQRHH